MNIYNLLSKRKINCKKSRVILKELEKNIAEALKKKKNHIFGYCPQIENGSCRLCHGYLDTPEKEIFLECLKLKCYDNKRKI